MHWDYDIFKQAYYRHLKRVEEHFKDRQKDLLIMNIVEGDGFETLINFLYNDFRDRKFPHLAQS